MRAGFSRSLAPTRRPAAAVILALAWAAAAILFGPLARCETLTLADCLRETAEHNPQIIQKRVALESAAGQRLVFHARPLPTLLLGGLAGQQGRQTTEDLQVSEIGPNGKPTTVTQASARPSYLFLIGTEALYQPIFDAAIPASWRRGNVEVAVARSNFLVTATAQLYAARVQFYGAFYQQENGVLLREISDSIGANVKGVTELLKAGLAGRQAQLQAQVQQVNFQPQIVANTGAFRSSLTTLLQTMGRPLGPGAAPEGSISLAGPWEDGELRFDPVAAARESRERRPDLQAMRDLIRSYTEDANIIRGGYYPLVRIYVTGELLPEDFIQGNRTNTVRPEDNTQETEISPGVRYDWNVIDTGNISGGAHRQDALRDALKIALGQLEHHISGDLAAVRSRFDFASKERDLFAANVGIASDTLHQIDSGVAQGTNSQLEFLDAQTSVLSTRVGLLGAQLQMSFAHAEFDRIIGGYLRFIEEGKPAAPGAPK
jgi:outer membrane protein TolC